MTERPLRTFFAVELDAATREHAAAYGERLAAGAGGDAIRWVPARNLHITLRFLGSTPRERLSDLVACVRRETASQERFEASLGALHVLPSARRPRILALEVQSDGRLEALSAAVERGVVQAGFDPEDRPFRAHLTLGRAHRRERPRPWLGREEPSLWPFPVASAVLFASELRREGATYRALERLPLCSQLTPNPSFKEASFEEKNHGQ